jgi:hypothetical protein
LLTSTESTPIEQSYSYRHAAHPFWITPKEFDFLKDLGQHLLSFYQAANRLYLDSAQGIAPRSVSEYLDTGKPASIIAYDRMGRFSDGLPGIIRPDLILTDPTDSVGGAPPAYGMVATELDSVPGGMGQTLWLAQQYPQQPLIGGRHGMRNGFIQMIHALSPKRNPVLAIIVSEESRSYFSEMAFLGEECNKAGLETVVAPPEAVSFQEEGVFVTSEKKCHPVQILYRFFELFDLKNVPQSEPILQAAVQGQMIITPPPKAHLEEKMLFAFLHHPALKSFWVNQMGHETMTVITKLFPKTWILHSSFPISNFVIGDRVISNFHELGQLGQKARRLIIKPSGFSEIAWGSRGVRVGHDLPEEEWSQAIESALAGFHKTPYVLQPFHKGRRVKMEYIDPTTNQPVPMEGRVRLSPYYFIDKQEAILGGVLATVCPLNKKLIHGMSEAIMAPCAIGKRDDEII